MFKPEIGPMLTASGTETLSGSVSGKSNVYFNEVERLSEGTRAYAMLDGSLRWWIGKIR